MLAGLAILKYNLQVQPHHSNVYRLYRIMVRGPPQCRGTRRLRPVSPAVTPLQVRVTLRSPLLPALRPEQERERERVGAAAETVARRQLRVTLPRILRLNVAR